MKRIAFNIAVVLLLAVGTAFAAGPFYDAVGHWVGLAEGDLDMNGLIMILDADGDTSIDAAIDDVIRFSPGGAEAMRIEAIGSTYATNAQIKMSNGPIYDGGGFLELGGSMSSSHGLASLDTGVSDALEVDGILYLDSGVMHLAETVTPTPIASFGALYTKADRTLYYQDGAGFEHVIGGQEKDITYSYRSGALGTHYVGGFYQAPAADANLTQASSTVTYGSASAGAKGAHAFVVAGGAGSVDAGTVSIVVSGTSYDPDTATRITSDAETIVADITSMATNAYYETSRKWLGQITYTLTPAGGATTYSADFNYGFANPEENEGVDFTVVSMHCQIDGEATDTGLDIELLHHKPTGWTYSAAAFVPGDGPIARCTTDLSTDCKIIGGEYFNYQNKSMSTLVDATNGEGVVIRVTTGANNSIGIMTCHIGVVD